MIKKRFPLHIVTLFNPEYLLKVEYSQLVSLPHIKRDTLEFENKKIKIAQDRGLDPHPECFGDGPVRRGFGKPDYRFRETWIPTNKLVSCLEDFDVRLIYTIDNSPRPSYKFEFRPDWGDYPSSLDEVVYQKILENLLEIKKVSIRQLWINPIVARIEELPLVVPAEIADETANLIIGCFCDNDHRKSYLDFENNNGVWWLIFSE